LAPSERRLMLYDRQTHRLRTLDTSRTSCGFCLRPTWVGNDYAVYNVCSARRFSCEIAVWHNGSVGERVRNTYPRTTYDGVLDESTLNLYYVKSTVYCGIFVSIQRKHLGFSPSSELF